VFAPVSQVLPRQPSQPIKSQSKHPQCSERPKAECGHSGTKFISAKRDSRPKRRRGTSPSVFRCRDRISTESGMWRRSGQFEFRGARSPLSLFTPLLTIMERLFAIPASQAFCERALWHLPRLIRPSSLNTCPDLALARLHSVVSFAKHAILPPWSQFWT
jgi:hypothetical protein